MNKREIRETLEYEVLTTPVADSDKQGYDQGCDHVYRESVLAPVGVICIKCGDFVGAWEP
jgi:hypothetical protein